LPDGESGAAAEARAAAVLDWLLRGNLMARAGVVVLFFGVAFLLKYSYQHLQVPIELRLTGRGAGGGGAAAASAGGCGSTREATRWRCRGVASVCST
jgi:hypothetical protein